MEVNTYTGSPPEPVVILSDGDLPSAISQSASTEMHSSQHRRPVIDNSRGLLGAWGHSCLPV
jgi:hypothetical protein